MMVMYISDLIQLFRDSEGRIGKLLSTRSTQLFSAKGTFCLYKGGMLMGADGKTLLRKLAHSGHLCSYLTDGPSWSALLILSGDKDFVGTRKHEKVWCDFLPLTLSGVVWHGSIPAENCCRA